MVPKLNFVGAKFCDLENSHEIWHLPKLTRYTVHVMYEILMQHLCQINFKMWLIFHAS